MRTALNIPALVDFQSGLHRAMECRPPRFDPEFAAIEREANKLRGWLGSRGSERPPQNASRAALREFVRLRDLPTLRHATLASFGCIDPFGDRKEGLISDAELFPMFLDRVDNYRKNPRALRACYSGLLHAYFLYDAASGPASGRANWDLLRNYLAKRANSISTTGFQPSWVGTLLANLEVLGPDPGTYYGKELFQGRSERFEQVRKDLAIADASWLVWRVLVGQIDAATDTADGEFRQAISWLIELLRRHPLALNFGLAKLLTRFRNCVNPTLHEQLRDFAVDAWGNPWLTINEAKWASVSPEARRMVANWLKLALVQKFFSLLAEDGRHDTRRLKFWETYHQSIHAMYFALGETARTHQGPDFKEIRKQMDGLQLTLTNGTANNNAFIMCIGEHVVVEFGLKGNACFIFKRDRLPFPLFGSVAGNYLALKHKSYIERLSHVDTSTRTWEDKFRTTLANVVNVRSPSHAAGRIPSGVAKPHVKLRTSGPTVARDWPANGQTPQMENSGVLGSVGTSGRRPVPPFSIGELRSFCNSHRLDWQDHRPKGGNLWVYTQQQGTEVSARLQAWGFRLKINVGWWRQ
jgi:hypothetical protein